MKFNKILIISMILISLFAIGAASAATGNADDIVEISDIDEVQNIEEVTQDEVSQDEAAQDSDAILADDDDETKLEATNAKVHVDVNDTEIGENLEVNVSLTDVDEDFNFSEVRYDIFRDGREIASNLTFDQNGKGNFSIDHHGLTVGQYYIEATVYNLTNGNVIVKGGNSFKVNPDNYIINVENIEANLYDTVTIPVTVTNSKGNKNMTNGKAIVTINWSGDSLSQCINITNGEGKAIFNFTDILGIFTAMNFASMMGDSGAMDWSSMFSQGGFNTSTFDWKNMNWSQMSTMFNGDGMNWSAMFNGNGGMTDTLSNMMAVTFEYIFVPGIYTVDTTFLPSQTQNGTNTTSNLTVLYPDDYAYLADVSVPKKYGDKTTVNLKVVDKRSKPMANITVSVVIDGASFGDVKLDENATAKFVLTNMGSGNHTLEFSSVINGTKSNGTTEFTVNLPKVNSTITAKDISIVAGKSGQYFTATLKDASGNVLANKEVQIIVDKKYTVTTDQNGNAKVQLNIAKANTYTCSICYLGDDSYNAAFEMVKVTVKKQTTKLNPAKKSYTFKAKAKKKVKVTLKNANGKAIKGKQITLKIKNKTFKAKTNAKGTATITVKFTKKGKYTVTTKFAGDNTYNSVSKKIKIRIK